MRPVVLYRVAQEALTNVTRHAQANRASVVVLRQRSSIKLLVEDDGRGFDHEAARRAGADACLGLVGMEERVALVGGSLVVASSPGKGTTVRAAIPISSSPKGIVPETLGVVK